MLEHIKCTLIGYTLTLTFAKSSQKNHFDDIGIRHFDNVIIGHIIQNIFSLSFGPSLSPRHLTLFPNFPQKKNN